MEGSRCGSSSVKEGSENLPPLDLHDLDFLDHDRGRCRYRALLGLGGQPSRGYQRPLPPPPRSDVSDQLLS